MASSSIGGSFMLSPGVNVREIDQSTIIPVIAASPAAHAGYFEWGPVLDPTIVDSETNLTRIYGEPSDTYFHSFFTCSNFLSYSSNLLVNRAESKWMFNACGASADTTPSATITTSGVTVTASTSVFSASDVGKFLFKTDGTVIGEISEYTSGTVVVLVAAPETALVSATAFKIGIRAFIKNKTDYEQGGHTLTNFGNFIARYPGAIGSSISVSMCDSSTWNKSGSDNLITTSLSSKIVTGDSATAFLTEVVPGSFILVGGVVLGQVASVQSDTQLTLVSNATIAISSATGYTIKWQYADYFDYAPAETDWGNGLNANNDELHVAIIDENGLFTGTAGTILELFKGVSKASDAKKPDGTNNYYKQVINETSQYVFWANHPSGMTNWGTNASGISFTTLGTVELESFTFGSNGTGSTDGMIMDAYQMFANDMLYDIALIPVGKANATVANYVIQNVAEVRKDCVAFVSAQNASTAEPIIGTTSTQANLIKTFADSITSSSYAFIDSGYKYQYDRYKDLYRWVPLNGDIAGLAARTDQTNDPWWSPAGFNRGQIKNIVKLAFNPGQTDRDTLYKNRVNPVVQFPGQGIILYGDKTALSRPSAFDRINVRRLFIILEKSIATAAKYQLFEFNDSFTRGRFRAMIEPFLRDVQGRRGIQQYQIVCDSSNNTSQIISTNQFVADIKIQPAYSINFITLNFIATNNMASFTETAG